ncbi:MAG: hypothetical protein ACI9JN_002438 [Bacteroidia bacterium]|jgi:hypothetical protein
MRKYIKITSLLVFVSLLQACGPDTPIPESELPSFELKLVVNAAFNNIEPLEIKISDNAGAYTNDLPLEYTDVTITLKADGSSVPLTYNSGTKSYKANSAAVPGKTYTIEVLDKAGERAKVFARTFTPEIVFNKRVGYIENGGVDIDGSPSDLLSLEWNDLAGSNYYMLHFYYYSETIGLFIPFDFKNNDATLKAPETLKLDDGGFLFNDVLFNGNKKRIEVVPPGGLVAGNTDVLYLIELRSVTQDYYKYHKTLQQYKDRDDLQQAGPFGSAVIVHSNIKNGLGAFIASTLESDTIR